MHSVPGDVTLPSLDKSQLRSAREGDSWESGGEDWPDAYRHSPMSSERPGAASLFLASGLGGACISAVCRAALWPAVGRDQFQPVL